MLAGTVNGGTASLVRTGMVVMLGLDSITFDGSAPGYGEIIRLPAGFRPAFTIRESYGLPSSADQIAIFGSSGGVSMVRPAGDTIRRVLTFVTVEAWPASLPGTAV